MQPPKSRLRPALVKAGEPFCRSARLERPAASGWNIVRRGSASSAPTYLCRRTGETKKTKFDILTYVNEKLTLIISITVINFSPLRGEHHPGSPVTKTSRYQKHIDVAKHFIQSDVNNNNTGPLRSVKALSECTAGEMSVVRSRARAPSKEGAAAWRRPARAG